MSTKLIFGSGKSQIEVIGPQKAIINQLLKEAIPEIKKTIEKELILRENYAKKRWPSRQERYGKSKRSRDKFRRLIRIIPPNQIQGELQNNAPYSWAIRAGKESNTPVKAGGFVADNLMWKIAKKRSALLTEKLANAIIQPIKMVK